MRNLGPKSEAMLSSVGIRTPEELASQGAINAFIALRQLAQSVQSAQSGQPERHGQAASLNMLWAMEGALSDRDWREVARDDKLRLLLELEIRGNPA